ncbi:MAG: hypothetical protein ABSD64_13830 [Terriglobales bacterium]
MSAVLTLVFWPTPVLNLSRWPGTSAFTSTCAAAAARRGKTPENPSGTRVLASAVTGSMVSIVSGRSEF